MWQRASEFGVSHHRVTAAKQRAPVSGWTQRRVSVGDRQVATLIFLKERMTYVLSSMEMSLFPFICVSIAAVGSIQCTNAPCHS